MINFEHLGPKALEIFDDSFSLVSFHVESDGRMTGASLLVDNRYLLDVETTELHMKRIDFGGKLYPGTLDESADTDEAVEQVYVIPASEILPTDLRDLKLQSRTDMTPFLVELED